MPLKYDAVTQGDIQTDVTVNDLTHGDNVLSIPPGRQQAIQNEMRMTNHRDDVDPGARLGFAVEDVSREELSTLSPSSASAPSAPSKEKAR